jgi:hypothetical protein
MKASHNKLKGSRFKGAIVIDPCLKASHNKLKGSKFKVQRCNCN